MVARLNTYIHVKLNSQFLRNENVYLHFTVLVNSVQQRQSLTYSNGSTSAGGCRACTLYETDPATMTTNQNKAIKLNSPIKRGHTTSWPIRTCNTYLNRQHLADSQNVVQTNVRVLANDVGFSVMVKMAVVPPGSRCTLNNTTTSN
jgi:hypothetical protein